jgi:hypothetical protein
MSKKLKADGVIHYSLQFCQPYIMESGRWKKSGKIGHSDHPAGNRLFRAGRGTAQDKNRSFRNGCIKNKNGFTVKKLSHRSAAVFKNGRRFALMIMSEEI